MSVEQISLERLGYSDHFRAEFVPYEEQGLVPARVAVEHRGAYIVYTDTGETWAEPSGALRHQALGRESLPAVGDWVAVAARAGEERATIRAVLPRQSSFSRKVAGFEVEQQLLASNVDVVWLMSALNADLNVRRIERYLTTAWGSGAMPVILLSKADLCPDVDEAVNRVRAVAPAVPIHVISAIRGQGLDQLAPYLEDHKTVAVLGSSGAGKSTLINELCGRPVQRVEEIREEDDRGRHTTTRRELVLLPGGGLVIDTPGLRELQLWDNDHGLDEAFGDIASLGDGCRFRDCRHEREPGCAITQAIEDGTLPEERLQSYRKLKRELHHIHTKRDRSAAAAEKRRSRAMTKSYRKNLKPR